MPVIIIMLNMLLFVGPFFLVFGFPGNFGVGAIETLTGLGVDQFGAKCAVALVTSTVILLVANVRSVLAWFEENTFGVS